MKEIKPLIVDDSKALRMVIKKVLASTNYLINTILEAGDGVEALEVLRTNTVDIVFTDINMPNMNGIELIQNMREKGYTVPVIVISTDGSQDTVIQSIKLGARGYIKKPFSADKVTDLLNKILS